MPGLRRAIFLALLGIATGPSGGCSGERARREEAARLADAIQALDVAARRDRREAGVAALRGLVLRDPALVRARDRCVEVHAGLLSAERDQVEAGGALKELAARHGARGIPPDEAARITLAIERSEQARAHAQAALPECEAATRDLLVRRR